MEFYIVHFRNYRIKMDTKPSSLMEVNTCNDMNISILCMVWHVVPPVGNFRKMSN